MNGHSVEPDFAFAGSVEAGEQPEKRALAAATGADDGDKLSRRNVERNPLQNFNAPRAVLDPLLRALDLDQRILRTHWQCKPPAPDPFWGKPPAPARIYTIVVNVWRRLVIVCWLVLAGTVYAADRPTIVCFGDSITAGYGLPFGQAYPDFLQKKLDAQGYSYKVENQGTSGATTKDAAGALPLVLRMHPAVVIVEFGGNDGLRGLPVEQSRNNLDQILTTLEKAHVKILLAGITLPPDYGPDYIRSFEQIFRELAAKHHVAYIPMLYKNLIHVPETIQSDGIHPTAKGSAIIADTVLPVLKPLLHKGP